MSWLDQLVDQGLLEVEGEYRILRLTARAVEVMQGRETPALYGTAPARSKARKKPRKERPPEPAPAEEPLDRRDAALYEKLRLLRKRIADETGVPAFWVFGDRSLREMAIRRPTTPSAFLGVKGVGPAKLESFGERFLEAIRSSGS
jgi:ATP-dependent DNA helicase RecQ